MQKTKFIKNLNFEQLPKISGVYLFYNGKELLYIGKAINIKTRVKNHFFQPSYRDNLFVNSINKIGFFETNSEIEALILEASLIKKHQPKFNVVWRDDKNYFYVAIIENSQKIPYIFITHQPKLQTTHYKLKTSYIGPFVEGTALKKTLKFLRKVFPYYTAKTHPKRKCTYCHLDLCPGPELFENPPSPKATEGLREYRRNIKKITLILQGKSNFVLNSLKKEMKIASKENKFETAGKIRDRIFSLQKIMAHASVISQAKTLNNNKFKELVSRIECYDVSNIQGKFATGSMIVFENGLPKKSEYKKFKIKFLDTPNDIAMLKEVLQRRFNHPEWKYPDTILIDGGKAQLNITIAAKNSNPKTRFIKVISIAKGKKELWTENKKDPIPLKSLSQKTYNLIKNLDDEAHRFAITYHKKLRKKNLLQ